MARPMNLNCSVTVNMDIETVSQACTVLVNEYRNSDVFRQAIIDCVNSITADPGLSERIADRLFDNEEEGKWV